MNQEQSYHYLGTERIAKLMLRFSIPCVFSLVISALYNIVDQIFIGNSELSALGNAATGIVFPVFVISQAVAWCVGDGCAAYLNICQGRRDTENAHKSVGTGVTLTFISGVIIAAVFIPFSRQILTAFGASDNILNMAVEYANVVALFLPVYMLSNMMGAAIRADGSPNWAMASIVIGAVINIFLDYLFIFVFRWGMFGAALATGIGQAVSFLIALIYFFNTKTFKLTLKSFVPDFKAFSGAFKLGISTFITQITIVVIVIVCNMTLAKYGAMSQYGADIPIAILGIESKVFTIVVNIVVGIVLGCQPIISYNMGARNYTRVRKIYNAILLCTVIVGIVATLLFQFAPRFIISLFGEPTNIPNPEDYWVFGEKTFRIFLGLVLFTCITKMTSIFFQASGKPVQATIVSMIRDLIFFVPLVLIMPVFWGIDGALFASPIADLVAMIITTVLTVAFIAKLKTKAK